MHLNDLVIFFAFVLFLYGIKQRRDKAASDSRLRDIANRDMTNTNRRAEANKPPPVTVDTGYVECLYCRKPIKRNTAVCPHCKTSENAGMVRMMIAIFTFCYVIIFIQNKEVWFTYAIWIVLGYFALVFVISFVVNRLTKKPDSAGYSIK